MSDSDETSSGRDAREASDPVTEQLEPSEEDAEERPNYVLHLVLFLVACVTTYFSQGLAFAATLMAILAVHEMGHYIAARIHHIDASLPYFIPLPPQFSLGTLGAIIKMRRPIENRNRLIDVGAAGPLAGLALAIPLLVIGLSMSEVSTAPVGGLVEGNSLAYIALKYAVLGRYLPAADGTDVLLHPMAFGAWVGILITMINLIPIGQLDGGHVARAYLGNRHERLSARLHWLLLPIGLGVGGWLFMQARAVGYALDDAAQHSLMGGLPWIVWSLGLLGLRKLSGGVYHPPVSGPELTPGRRRLVLLVAIIFVLTFTPIPFRQSLMHPLGEAIAP